MEPVKAADRRVKLDEERDFNAVYIKDRVSAQCDGNCSRD